MTIGRRVAVKPERDPRQDDDEAGRHVDVNDVVTETSCEVELARQPRVVACSAVRHAVQHTDLPPLILLREVIMMLQTLTLLDKVFSTFHVMKCRQSFVK